MLIENFKIEVAKPYASAGTWVGTADITWAVTCQLALKLGVKAKLLIEVNATTLNGVGQLLFTHDRGNRNITLNHHTLHVAYVDRPEAEITDAVIDLGVDDVQIDALLKTLIGEDEQSHLRWFIGKAFKTNTNPLPVLRKMLPGEWKFHQITGSGMASVWYGEELVWTGPVPRILVNDIPKADAVQ